MCRSPSAFGVSTKSVVAQQSNSHDSFSDRALVYAMVTKIMELKKENLNALFNSVNRISS